MVGRQFLLALVYLATLLLQLCIQTIIIMQMVLRSHKVPIVFQEPLSVLKTMSLVQQF